VLLLVLGAVAFAGAANAQVDTAALRSLNQRFSRQVYTDPDSALALARAYAAIAESGGSSLYRAKAAAMTGQAWYIKGHRAEALPHFQEALMRFTALHDTASMAMVHGNIGSVYMDERRFLPALEHLRAAVVQFLAADEPIWAAGLQVELGAAYEGAGLPDSAMLHYRLGAEGLAASGMHAHAVDAQLNTAGILLEQGDAARALATYREAVADSTGASDDVLRCRILINLGRHAAELEQFARADSALQRALRMAVRGGFDLERADLHAALADLCTRTGRHAEAAEHLRAHLAWKDSLDAHRTSATIAELHERYEGARKDAELEHKARLLGQQRTRLTLAIGGLVAAAVLVLVLVRGRRRARRAAHQLADTNTALQGALKDRELLLRELHHRVKNSLQTVTSLLRVQARGVQDAAARETLEEAGRRVKSMALVHQDLYLKPGMDGVAMETYVPKLAEGLLRAHAMEERVALQLQVDPVRLNADSAIPLGLVLNELLTNALKHAFPNGRRGTIQVRLEDRGAELAITVHDDGVGFNGAERAGDSGLGSGILATFADSLRAAWTVHHDAGTEVRMVVRHFLRA
jgi:two-component sensor histidine kinase